MLMVIVFAGQASAQKRTDAPLQYAHDDGTAAQTARVFFFDSLSWVFSPGDTAPDWNIKTVRAHARASV